MRTKIVLGVLCNVLVTGALIGAARAQTVVETSG